MALRAGSIILLLLQCKAVAAGGPPPGWKPSAQILPQIDGATFPGFTQIFRGGECDGSDANLPWGPINPAKRCYSCFRIPALVRNPKTGTLHAFSEARRGDLGNPDGCPDIPDTKVAYKRSTDGGFTWSPLRILEGPGAQASPVIDESTGTLHVLLAKGIYPHYITVYTNSTNDGVTFSPATEIVYKQPGSGKIQLSTNGAQGHYVTNASSTLLVFPGQFGAIYSDDHGASWSCKYWETGLGESQFTRCNPPSVCQGHAFAATNRGRSGTNMAFSDDMVNWGPMRALEISRFSNYSQASGLLGVPGAMLLSHGGSAPLAPGMLGGKGDPGGMDLLWSEDTITWKLLRRLWPLRSGYSTLSPLEVDSKGNVVTYAVVFEAADLLRVDAGLIYENFTWTKPSHIVQV